MDDSTIKRGFINKLRLEFEDGFDWKVYQVKGEEFGYRTRDGRTITPKNGQCTDFASIPWFFRRIFPKTGTKHFPFGPAAVIHDTLCREQKLDGKPITRKFADQTFLDAMIDNRMPTWAAKIFFWLVKYCGGRAWKANTKALEANAYGEGGDN